MPREERYQRRQLRRAPKAPAVRVRVGRAICDIYSTEPMTCFLCGERVPPRTHHHCETPKQEPRS